MIHEDELYGPLVVPPGNLIPSKEQVHRYRCDEYNIRDRIGVTLPTLSREISRNYGKSLLKSDALERPRKLDVEC